jgi:pimeloyl-ACP methyl ester carboxylesterase
MPVQTANGAELYYEVSGDGAPLLLTMGATGYGGVFARFAELLENEFTVVTYDRRGNARSPPPPDWDTTSPEEQADDAAALLEALGLAPAAIFGTSSGGIFALETVIRHPAPVRGAILHEPALFSLFDDPEDLRKTLTVLITEGMESGGPATALERFIRFVAGDPNWEGLDPSAQASMIASADTYFGIESGAFDTYLPSEEKLDQIRAPVEVLVGDASFPAFSEAAGRLAHRLGVEVTRTPGAHFAYLDRPEELSGTVKPFLRAITA